MLHTLKITGLCTILLALIGIVGQVHAQQDVYQLNQPVGDAGGSPDPDPFYFYPTPGTVATEMLWADGKQLEAGPGILGFHVHGFTAGTQSFTGYLLDSGLNPIDGTEFSGASNVDASQIDLAETTRFSGIYITLGTDAEQSLQGYMFNWVGSLTVVGDDAVGNQPPIADAGRPISWTAGVGFQFNGSGSEDPDGRIVRYDWDPGVGPILEDAGPTPQYTYEAPGTYNVTLTVTDNEGAISSDTNTATIARDNEAPIADAGGEPPVGMGTYFGTVGVPVQFDGSRSRDDLGIVRYSWDFGDAQDSDGEGMAPEFAYGVAGQYTVTLTVFDEEGESGLDWAVASISGGNQPPEADAGPPVAGTSGEPVAFDGTASDDPGGTIVRYDWKWGDGNEDQDAGPTPQHTYGAPGDYTVTLIVVGDDGVSDSDTTSASIDSGPIPPLADAGGPYEGTPDAAIEFDGTASDDLDGLIVRYDWSFGDGNNATGPSTTNTYTATGNYTVELTVTDNDGLTSTDTQQVTIADGNQPPTANPNQAPIPDAGGLYAGVVGQTIQFSGAGSSDPDGTIVQSRWDFGDGGASSQLNPTYTYDRPGWYTVGLVVTDDEGVAVGDSTLAIIGDGLIPPTADPGGPYIGEAGKPVTFSGAGSNDPDGTIAEYSWYFGDMMPGTGEQPDHTYLGGGRYNVSLQVTDDAGLTASAATRATIGEFSQPPTADAGGPYLGSTERSVAFDGGASSDPDGTIAQYDWDFGDGPSSTGTGVSPRYTYAEHGRYLVTLTVTDDSGETNTDITVVKVGIGNLPPRADAGDTRRGRAGRGIGFDGTGSRDLDIRPDPNAGSFRGDAKTLNTATATSADSGISRYEWDFGDGNTGSGPTPSHSYASAGVYRVRLTVTDGDGASSSDVTLAEISGGGGGGGGGGSSGLLELVMLALTLLLATLRRTGFGAMTGSGAGRIRSSDPKS